MKITLAHGSGGKSTTDLIDSVFAKAFSNDILNMMEDSALVSAPAGKKIAVTTDSFVVTPLFFNGGDIGRLCVCGTVNDLLMRGAVPKYITSAFIIEQGADTADLEKIAASMARAAEEAGVCIIAGDTKVIDGSGGIYINTSGIGFACDDADIQSKNTVPGDAIIVSGTMGEHHAAILSGRMGVENNIKSDAAPLCEMVFALMREGIAVHTMRDITRGGLGTVLNELANASKTQFVIKESLIPVSNEVRAFSEILGLNILHMGNEGKLVLTLPESEAQKALEIIKKCRYGENAAIIGSVCRGSGVLLETPLGAHRKVSILYGEGLPRIC